MSEDNQLIPQENKLSKLSETDLPAAWGTSEKSKKAIQKSVKSSNVRHGLYASIPMICRGDECAYKETCPLFQVDEHPEGERCPLEISEILTKFDSYTKELGIETYDNIIDMTLIKDLIDLDVQISRADRKLAIDGDFIQMVTITITEDGDEIQNPAIHKAVEYKEKLLKKRHDVLQLLNSTRKDKAGDKLSITLDPSTYASQLVAQAMKMKGQPIDITDEADEE